MPLPRRLYEGLAAISKEDAAQLGRDLDMTGSAFIHIRLPPTTLGGGAPLGGRLDPKRVLVVIDGKEEGP